MAGWASRGDELREELPRWYVPDAINTCSLWEPADIPSRQRGWVQSSMRCNIAHPVHQIGIMHD